MDKFSIPLSCLAGVFIGISTSGGGVLGFVLGIAGGFLCYLSGYWVGRPS